MTEHPYDLVAALREIAKQSRISYPNFKTLEQFVLEYGKPFTPMPFPDAYRKYKGVARNCYRNVYRLVRKHPTELRYVEGYAVPAVTNACLQHGWAVDSQNRVIDPTWEPMGVQYFGVMFALDYVSRITHNGRGKVASVIDDYDTESPFALISGRHTDWMWREE